MCRRLVLFLVSFMFVVPAAQASQSMQMPVCTIKGIVVSEAIRKEPGRGISEGEMFKYHDVTINLVDQDFADEAQKQFAYDPKMCQETGVEKTYQKRAEGTLESLGLRGVGKMEGKCITAKTNFFGDGNFMSGNWLYDIKELDMSACE